MYGVIDSRIDTLCARIGVSREKHLSLSRNDIIFTDSYLIRLTVTYNTLGRSSPDYCRNVPISHG